VKCPDIAPLVPRFFDGELDGSQMRTVALHITRCRDCEDDLRLLERLQSAIARQAAADIAAVDLTPVWDVVAAQIGDVPVPWTQRLRVWWDDLEILSPVTALPVLAGAAAVLFAVNFWSVGQDASDGAKTKAMRPEIVEHVEEAKRQLANLDNSAVFESIVGGVDGLMIEPSTKTAVLWISDSGEIQ
jgi:hypothetical protein